MQLLTFIFFFFFLVAGKSITIHYLSVSQFKRNEKNGHYDPIHIKNKDCLKLKTECLHATSVTKYISTVKIILSEEGIKSLLGRNIKDKILLVDTPGFNDTNGA